MLQQSADTLTLKPSGEFSVPEKPATIASEVHFLTNPNRNRVLRKGIRIRLRMSWRVTARYQHSKGVSSHIMERTNMTNRPRQGRQPERSSFSVPVENPLQ